MDLDIYISLLPATTTKEQFMNVLILSNFPQTIKAIRDAGFDDYAPLDNPRNVSITKFCGKVYCMLLNKQFSHMMDVFFSCKPFVVPYLKSDPLDPRLELQRFHHFLPFTTGTGDTLKSGWPIDSFWVREGRYDLFRSLLHLDSRVWLPLIDETIEKQIGENGTTDICDMLIDHGFAPTEVMLAAAISRGKIDIIDRLLNHGVTLNREGDFRYDDSPRPNLPIIQAIEKRDITLMEKLFVHGADVDKGGIMGICPIFYAIDSFKSIIGGGDVLRKFLEFSPNCNVTTLMGKHCLVAAIEKNIPASIIEKFIELGADIYYEPVDTIGIRVYPRPVDMNVGRDIRELFNRQMK